MLISGRLPNQQKTFQEENAGGKPDPPQSWKLYKKSWTDQIIQQSCKRWKWQPRRPSAREPWGKTTGNSARRVQCYNCEKMGHFSRDCPEPPKQHYQAALTHLGGSRPKTNHKQSFSRKPSYKARVAVLSDKENPDAFCFCTGLQKGVKAEEWVVDSGATTHMTWDKGVFVTYAAMEDMPNVRLGDGGHVKAKGRGSVCLRVKDDRYAERVIRLSSVLYVFCMLLIDLLPSRWWSSPSDFYD